MINVLWQVAAGKLADRWLGVSASSALYWLVGLASWWWADGPGVDAAFSRLQSMSAISQVVVSIAIAAVVVVSGLIVDELSGSILRFLEGYWPGWTGPLQRSLTRRVEARRQRLGERFQQLMTLHDRGEITAAQRTELVEVDVRLRRIPTRPLPTRFGNILRSAEHGATAKYGLDAVGVWPHLWLVLPESTQRELITARTRLLGTARAVAWSALIVLFTPWAWWMAVIAVIAVALLVTMPLRTRAEVFADLVEATFDLYRDQLYRQLRWPLPRTPHESIDSGRLVSVYLRRGLDGDIPRLESGD